MADAITSRIVVALRRAFSSLDHGDEARFAFHCGRAGGMAAAAGVFGIKALELCDDISDAYENGGRDFLKHTLSELGDRPGGNGKHRARTRESGMDWRVYGSVLRDALRSHDEHDTLRYSLMIGFAIGLMYRTSGPSYDVADVVRGIAGDDAPSLFDSKQGMGERVTAAIGPESEKITVRSGIRRGYEADCRDLIEWAEARTAAGVRLSDPMPFMTAAEAARHYEEGLRTMRWAQNFGLRSARARDESVSVPNSMSINYSIVSDEGEPDGG